jgi:regulator of sigma E protease
MLFAGVFMNFLLCFVILSLAFMIGIPSMVDDQLDTSLKYNNAQVQIMSLSPDSPAVKADLRVGDTVLGFNNTTITSIEELQTLIANNENQSVNLFIKRGEEELIKTVIPVKNNSLGQVIIGVGLVKTAIIKYPWYRAFPEALKMTINLTIMIIGAFGTIIYNIFRHGQVAADVSGPVGIAVLTGQVVKLGWVYIMQFTALLSLNLSIINLLPIPALDGGRILFLIIEKIKGRPMQQKLEAAMHQVGFLFLMGLIILVTFKDLHSYGSKIWQALSSIF